LLNKVLRGRAISRPSAGNIIVVARVTQVEVFSGISRRKREGTVTVRTAQAIRLLLNRHIQREYIVIELRETLIQNAQNFLDKYMLRAYDSIQLASAFIANNQLLAAKLLPLVFVSADARLLNAATAEGLSFDDPKVHP
jgi:predicted nucleic acid-binding protein